MYTNWWDRAHSGERCAFWREMCILERDVHSGERCAFWREMCILERDVHGAATLPFLLDCAIPEASAMDSLTEMGANKTSVSCAIKKYIYLLLLDKNTFAPARQKYIYLLLLDKNTSWSTAYRLNNQPVK
jgi:hypothetical protein